MDRFDVAYSVSDLHLGGVNGIRIFHQGELLCAALQQIAEEARRRRVALVLNGDLVDFLAEAGAAYFDPDGALDKLKRVAGDPGFRPVFDGLADVADAGGTVVLTLGNHDLELTRHACIDWLTQRVTRGGAARGRLVLALDGQGYRCEVGREQAWFVHGNDWDSWNAIDHAALAAATRAEDLEPCPGTRLVIDVMNPIKKRYPFVDLLKPEGATLAAFLASVASQRKAEGDPGYPALVARFARSYLSRLWRRLTHGDMLGAPVAERIDDRGDLEVCDAFVADVVRSLREAVDGDALLRAAEESHRAGRCALDRARAGEDGTLARGVATLRALASVALADDRTFVAGEAARVDAFAAAHGRDVDYLVVGHTHLRRAVAREAGGAYFNSGTWADLLRVPPEALPGTAAQLVFDASDAFEDFVEALESGQHERYVHREPTVVVLDGAARRGYLAEAAQRDDHCALDPIPGTSLSPRRPS